MDGRLGMAGSFVNFYDRYGFREYIHVILEIL